MKQSTSKQHVGVQGMGSKGNRGFALFFCYFCCCCCCCFFFFGLHLVARYIVVGVKNLVVDWEMQAR